MKRSKVSSKMANVVHSGWMTKSPPERKVNAPFKIFRSQWKKRFFVLRKPSGSLPDEYELYYYKDENCTRSKGFIDLEQCEQIIESLDSELFPYLLAIKTIFKNKVRTYYLAVDTQTEMTSWVQCLCHVCGLKQEDTPTDIPEPKPAVSLTIPTRSDPFHSSNGHAGNNSLSNSASPNAISTAMVINTQPISKDNTNAKARNDVAGMSPTYIPLDQCVTGCPIRVDRSESTESVPDFPAPAAPPKHVDPAHEDDVFISELYQRPPRQHTTSTDDGAYNVPPSRTNKSSNPRLSADEMSDGSNKNTLYQVPPARSKRETRANSDRTDSVSSSNAEIYDYPPPSYKEADVGAPPDRPPRTILQSPYQNLIVTQGTNAAITEDGDAADLSTILAPPKPHSSANTGYDVPRSNASAHYVSPPPPVPHRPTQRGGGYMNAHLNHLPAPASTSLNEGKRTEASADGRLETDSLSITPAIPPRSGSTSGDGQDGRSGSPNAIYHHPPPSSASSSSSSASGAPARPPARVTQRGQQLPDSSASHGADGQLRKEDTSVIFSTTRTRSFKKHHIVKPIKQGNRAHTLPMSVPVPAPRPVPGDYTSSDDGDDESTHHSLSLLRAVPPPSDPERELKYIDLDLDHPEMMASEAARSSTSHSHHSHASHSHHMHSHLDRSKDSAIEYREIDFVKTKALKVTKQAKDELRKTDDHN